MRFQLRLSPALWDALVGIAESYDPPVSEADAVRRMIDDKARFMGLGDGRGPLQAKELLGGKPTSPPERD